MNTRVTALDFFHTLFLDLIPFYYYHSPDVAFDFITSIFRKIMIFFNVFQHCIKEPPKYDITNGEHNNNKSSLLGSKLVGGGPIFEPIDGDDEDDDHSPFVDDDASELEETRDDTESTMTPSTKSTKNVVRFAPSNDNIIHPPSFNRESSSYSPERTITTPSKSKKDGSVITIPTSKPDREVIVTNDSVIVVTKDKVIVTKKPRYPGDKPEVVEMKRTPTKDRNKNTKNRHKVLSPTTPATPFSSPSSATGGGVGAMTSPVSPRSYTKSCHF